jgi:hypothetical protein
MSSLFKAALEEETVIVPEVEEVALTPEGELDTTEQQEEMVALESQLIKLTNVANNIVSIGGITKSIVMEARDVMPEFGKSKPLAMYSATPTVDGSEVALEGILETIKNTVRRICEAIMKFLRKIKEFFFGTAMKRRKDKFQESVRKFREAVAEKTRNTFSRNFAKGVNDAFDEIFKKNMNSEFSPKKQNVDDILKSYSALHKDDEKFNKLYNQKNKFFGAFLSNTGEFRNYVSKNGTDLARKEVLSEVNDFSNLVSAGRVAAKDLDFLSKTPTMLSSIVGNEVERLKGIVEKHLPKVASYSTISIACETFTGLLEKFDFNKELDLQEAFVEKVENEISNILDKTDSFSDDVDKMNLVAKALSEANKNISTVINFQLFLEKIIDQIKSFIATCFYIDIIIVRHIEKVYHEAGLTPPDDIAKLHKRLSATLVV